MRNMTRLLNTAFGDHLFCGNQKQSGTFKITKEGLCRVIQKQRNVFRLIELKLERSSWKLLRAGNLLGTK